MKEKILSALVSTVMSFAVLTVLSYFMSRFLLGTTQTFMDFFEEKWAVIMAVVVVFVGYRYFFLNRK